MRVLAAILALIISGIVPANAQEREGEFLYHVTTVRAAPGELENLLNWIAEMKSSSYFDEAGAHLPFVMRHSQGDQWDLLSITPMESWTKFHSKSATRKREKAAEKFGDKLAKGFGKVAFAEDHFAFGPPLKEVMREYADNDFYHIEMFHAASGKVAELFEQRRMENAYLEATGQTTNMIFRRAAGSDVDVFTIGFHKNLQAFAEPSGANAEEAEAAAVAAGFKNRADISFYLRSLLAGHHDTLAVKVE
ncbi:MAG: hypothetical protein HKN14_10935 [Marinicaulis sp.]|nr:hypothetical protein [Marinicaulis sp.]